MRMPLRNPSKKAVRLLAYGTVLTALIGVVTLVAGSHTTHAANTADFDPGNIISDSVFYNPGTMSVSDIQNFLNSKVTSCNTSAPGYTGSTTGTVYNPPWVCLKDFYENPSSSYVVSFSYKDTSGNTQTGSRTYYDNNDYKYTSLTPVYVNGDYTQGIDHLTATISSMNGTVPTGAISAAQIIYNVAQQYDINPEVLLVLLQKEQGLITDTSPAPWEYQSAAGYGCPDFSPCSSNYAGFSNQLSSAAWQFQRYQSSPSSYSFLPNRNNFIQWSPNASCGGSYVYITNQATAGLYNYTPYQPNAAALAAGYGDGDACSSSGNRNFWLYFTDWFGSTQGVTAQANAVWRLYNPYTSDHLLTASATTATLYITKGWKNDGVVMHTALSGGNPVYQLWNGNSHFYTDDTTTLNAYLAAGWSNDGTVFNAPSDGSPVYQLWNGQSHFYTDNTSELTTYKEAGWKDDGIAFYEPTNEIDPVWRLYNPFSRDHLMTDNASEANTYLANGWYSDGIVFRGYKQSNSIPVYQLWNGSSHFYTADATTKQTYVNSGWKDDGIAFNTSTTGSPVYQLWNGSSHFYTADSQELSTYLSAGWSNDGIVFYTTNISAVSRLYNPATGAHTLVTNYTNLWPLLTQGWTNDGIIFNESTSYGNPVYALSNSGSGSSFYTASSSERTTYINAGWTDKGIAFYAPTTSSTPLYRFYNPSNQTHIIVTGAESSTYTNAGWTNDGIVFYGM